MHNKSTRALLFLLITVSIHQIAYSAAGDDNAAPSNPEKESLKEACRRELQKLEQIFLKSFGRMTFREPFYSFHPDPEEKGSNKIRSVGHCGEPGTSEHYWASFENGKEVHANHFMGNSTSKNRLSPPDFYTAEIRRHGKDTTYITPVPGYIWFRHLQERFKVQPKKD